MASRSEMRTRPPIGAILFIITIAVAFLASAILHPLYPIVFFIAVIVVLFAIGVAQTKRKIQRFRQYIERDRIVLPEEVSIELGVVSMKQG